MPKTVNYTAENVAKMREVYCAADGEKERDAAIVTLATDLGKTVASIRSKLSFEGVYIAKAKPESKSTRTTKADLMADIADNAQHPNDAFFDSLSGANRDVLRWVIGLQTQIHDLENELFAEADEGDAE